MGGVVNVSHYCCIHESNFKDGNNKKENIETIEQNTLDMGDKTIDRVESFIHEFSPSRKQSKQSNADN